MPLPGIAKAAIGRIGSTLIAPNETLDLYVFIDAGGRATEKRVWGGVAAMGQPELEWINSEIERLKVLYPNHLENNGELKGGRISLSDAKETGRRLLDNDRRILFWAHYFGAYVEDGMSKLNEIVSNYLDTVSPNPMHLEHKAIKEWHRLLRSYFDDLKDINRYKILSLLIHLHWLGTEIRRCVLGPQLRSVQIVIDNENLPMPEETRLFVNSFAAASFQANGMSYRRTGGVFRIPPTGGNDIVVNTSGNSHTIAGLQLVDILLQAVQKPMLKTQSHTE